MPKLSSNNPRFKQVIAHRAIYFLFFVVLPSTRILFDCLFINSFVSSPVLSHQQFTGGAHLSPTVLRVVIVVVVVVDVVVDDC